MKKEKKPLTKTQKIVLSTLVLGAVAAIGIHASLSGHNSSLPPPPPLPSPLHAPAKASPMVAAPSAAPRSAFTPTIHALPPARKSAIKAASENPDAAVNFIQSASQGTSWGVYSTAVLNHPHWFAVLYRTKVALRNLYSVAWVNPSAHLVVLGSVLGANGTPWTFPNAFLRNALRHGVHLPAVDQTQANNQNAAVHTAWETQGIHVGKKGPLVTVFFDPNSASAAHLYDTLSTYVRAGKMQIQWVPIGILRKSSLYRAEYLLSAPESQIVLKEDLAHFHFHADKGGSPKLYHAPTTMMEKIDGNANILANTGHIGPLSIFLCDQGHPQAFYHHIPSRQWPALVANLSDACG